MFVAAETKRYGMIGKSVFAFRLYRSHSLYYLCKLMVSAIVCDELRDECRYVLLGISILRYLVPYVRLGRVRIGTSSCHIRQDVQISQDSHREPLL